MKKVVYSLLAFLVMAVAGCSSDNAAIEQELKQMTLQ